MVTAIAMEERNGKLCKTEGPVTRTSGTTTQSVECTGCYGAGYPWG